MKNSNLKPYENSLHHKFQIYGNNAKEWLRKCAFLLPEIEKRRIWEKKGFSCIYEYAAKLAGMNRNQVNESLRILRKTNDKSELMKVVLEKGIWAIKPVANIATKETQKFWAEKARTMSARTLETYVKEFKSSYKQPNRHVAAKNLDLFNKSNPKNNPDSQTEHPQNPDLPDKAAFMNLSPETLQKLEKLKGNNDWETLMNQLLKEREENLDQNKPKPVKTSSPHIPAKIQKYILKKTNHNCAFPSCTKPYEILHHTKRFALYKTHDPDYIVPLCKAHERLAHLGLIENEEKPPQYWKIRKHREKYDIKNLIDQRVNEYRTSGCKPIQNTEHRRGG